MKKLRTFVLTLSLTAMAVGTKVYATSGELGLGNTSAQTLGKSAVSKFLVPFRVFGGVAIVLSVMSIILALIVANKRPQDRADVMARLPWIAGISFAVGSISLVAGYVLSFGS